MSEADDEEPSRRQVARKGQRELGANSARLANALMKLPPSALSKLGLDESLRDAVVRARAVTAQVARRRAERSLAGALRRVDLEELARRLDNVRATGLGEPQRLHQAERWRTRLLEEEGGPEAFRAAFPTANLLPLPRLLEAARSERATGKPPGAARALFRHISAVLEAASASALSGDGDDDDDRDDANDGKDDGEDDGGDANDRSDSDEGDDGDDDSGDDDRDAGAAVDSTSASDDPP